MDIHIVARMDPENLQPTDYYLLPSIDIEIPEFRLTEFNGASVDTFRSSPSSSSWGWPN